MQKKKDVDNDIVKLKLFPFCLRDREKNWFSSLPHNSIDSWDKCKDAFITKYFLPAKIISLRTQIMNFKRSMNMLCNLGKNEIDAKKLSYSLFKSLDDHTNFLCMIEFCL